MEEFKKGDRVSAWKMGTRVGKERIVGVYRGFYEGPRGDFAIIRMDDGGLFRVRPKTLRAEGSA